MNASPWTPRATRFALLSGLALSSLVSCEPSNKVKPGPPQLVLFAPTDTMGFAIALADPDGGAPVAVSPRSLIAAVFDRILDPTYLEDLTDAGPQGKAGVVSVQVGKGETEPSIVYTPNGDKDGLIFSPNGLIPPPWNPQQGPNIIVTPKPTLPSGTTVTVTLSKDKVKSKAGESFVVATDSTGAPRTNETLTFTTEPLSVAFAPAPDADAGATCGAITPSGDKSAITLTFNNVVDLSTLTPSLSVTAKGADGAVIPNIMNKGMYTASPDDAGVIIVSPLQGDGGVAEWPVGATLTVTVGANAQDVALGNVLGTPSSACFVVGESQ